MKSQNKTTTHLLTPYGLIFLLLIASLSAEARLARVDGSLDLYPGTGFVNDGAQLIPLITQDRTLPGRHNNPFSINFFGTTYDQVYANENGVLSFGSAFNGNPGNTIFDTVNTPLLAGYLADADMSVNVSGTFTGINTKYTDCLFACLFFDYGSTYKGATGSDPLYNVFQIAFWALNDTGDFKLEYNFSNLQWESGDTNGGTGGLGGIPGIVGFSSGDGRSYQIDGSGTSNLLGAFLDNGSSVFCNANPLSTMCNDYDFYFYNGIPYFDREGTQRVPLTSTVPEPPTSILLLIGFIILLFNRKTITASAN